MEVRVVETVNLPLERAWPTFSDFGGLIDAAPAGSMVVTGEGVGAERSFTNADGVIIERLESLDHVNHSFSYAILNDDAPIPVSGYVGTVNMRALGPDSCEILWTGEFTPRGAPEEILRETFTRAYRDIIRFLDKKARE
jgi:hypothetical protein